MLIRSRLGENYRPDMTTTWGRCRQPERHQPLAAFSQIATGLGVSRAVLADDLRH